MKFFFLNLFTNLCFYLFLELLFGVIVIVINHKCTGSKKWPFKCVWSYLMNYPQLSIKQNDISLASSFLEPILGIKFAAFWNQFCSLFSLIKIYDILTASRATQIISWNTFFVMFVFVHYLTEKPKYFTTTMYKFSIWAFLSFFFVKSNNYIFFS